MYILRRLSVFFSSWANIDILHVDSRLLWIETWFIQPLGLVIPCSGFPVLQQPGWGGCADATLTVDLAAAQTRREAVLAIIHHHHHHHHHAQKRSSSRLTLPVKVSWTQTRLLSNSTFSDSRPHSQFSEARVFQARTLAPPVSGLHSDLQRHAREKTFLYSKLTDARVTQNAPTPGQLRCTKSGVRRCDGLRLASAALSDKMN